MFHGILYGIKQGRNGSHVNKEDYIHQSQAYLKPRRLYNGYRDFFFSCCWRIFSEFFRILRRVNGRVFNNYQDACRELQLLQEDNHWDLTLADAALVSTANSILRLFAIILTCYPTQLSTLWEKYKNYMTTYLLHRVQ